MSDTFCHIHNCALLLDPESDTYLCEKCENCESVNDYLERTGVPVLGSVGFEHPICSKCGTPTKGAYICLDIKKDCYPKYCDQTFNFCVPCMVRIYGMEPTKVEPNA